MFWSSEHGTKGNTEMSTQEIMAEYEANANRQIEATKRGGFLLTICDALCSAQWLFTFWMI
jgi:hypothetical protein